MKTFNFDYDNDDGVYHFEGRITDYHPATMYKRNGDPGDPEEGGEIEIDVATLDDVDIDIDGEWDQIIIDNAEEEEYDDE